MGAKRPKSLKNEFKTRHKLQYTQESEAKKINDFVRIYFTKDDFCMLMFNKIIILIHL